MGKRTLDTRQTPEQPISPSTDKGLEHPTETLSTSTDEGLEKRQDLAETIHSQGDEINKEYVKRILESGKSPEEQEAARKTLRDHVATKSIKDIRFGMLFEELEEGLTPEQIKEKVVSETLRRIMTYTDYEGEGLPNNHWFTLNYKKIDNMRGGGSRHEMGIGLGDILVDPDIITILVERNGEIIKGSRTIVSEPSEHAGRVGFVDEAGDYISTHTGDKFMIVENERSTDNEDFQTRFEEEKNTRNKEKSTFRERQNSRTSGFSPEEQAEIDQITQELKEEGYPDIPEKVSENKREAFIEIMTPIAKRVGDAFNIPWQAIVLQAALETGFNFKKGTIFGIKSSSKKPSFVAWTHEFRNGKMQREKARFLKVTGATLKDKLNNSCIEYCKLMLRAKKYYGKGVEIYQKEGGTPRDFIREISTSYATDPGYAGKLFNIAATRNIDIDTPNTIQE